jgi:dihydroxyacetone kinase-like protein
MTSLPVQAATALSAILPELAGQDVATQLRRCGSELARKAPSTCGTLIATGFLRAARVAGPTPAGGPIAQLADALAAARAGIEERGGAAPGDRTLLDALAPAVQAIREAAASGADLATALAQAAEAAASGAEATRTMRAKVGRAGWLADRAAGHVDAGAYLVALAFRAAAGAVAPDGPAEGGRAGG